MNTLLIIYTFLLGSIFPAAERQATESLQLQLSEEIVATGENLWFQGTLLSKEEENAETMGKSQSKVLYVEILNQSASVFQGIYSIKNGLARGQILIPDTLSGGWYQVRAYTQWMRNSGDYCSQALLIINPYEDQLSLQQPTPASPIADVTFFPEGGNYVEGLPNHMLVQLSAEVMLDTIKAAKVMSLQDSTVVADVEFQSGQGSFTFTPDQDTDYVLEIYTATEGTLQDTVRKALPQAQVQGTTLQAQMTADGLQLSVHHAKRSKYSLLLRNANAVLYSESYHDDRYATDLDAQVLSPGLMELLVLDEAQEIVASRLLFNPAEKKDDIQIKLDKDVYQPREQVNAALSMVGMDASAQIAVTVRKLSPLTKYLQQDQLTGSMPVAKENHETSNETNSTDWLNQSLIAQKSPFPPLKQNISSPHTFSMEEESLTVSGTVKSLNDMQVGGRVIVLSVPGKNPYFEYDFVNADGSFQIPIKENVIGRKDIILQMADTSQQVEWTLDEKFMQENTYRYSSFPAVSEEGMKTLLQAYVQRSQIKSQYDRFETQDSSLLKDKKDFRFYGAPNFETRLEDYIELPNFVEINRELMPGIRLRESKGKYNLDVFDIPSRTFLPGEPTVFIDGVLIHDLAYLVNYPAADIEWIETVNRRTYYGEYRFDGTIAIFTKAGDAYLAALPATAMQEERNLYTPYTAFSPQDSLKAYEPDFRTLLYWQAGAKISHEPYSLSYSNADELGDFEIIVEGITEEGKRIYGRKSYSVSLADLP